MSGSQRLFAWVAAGIGAVSFLCFLGKYGHMLDLVMPHGSDDLGYYQFLPALFVQHDINAMQWVHVLDNGARLNLFTIGVAVLQLPFFLVAHATCLLGLAEADGYTWPYAIARAAAAATYAALGCWFMLRTVADRFGRNAALITLLALFFATNLFFYAALEPGMSHVYSFFLFAVLMHSTVHIIEAPSAALLFRLCITSALIVLVRPANALVLLLPFLYGAPDLNTVWERLRWPVRFPSAFLGGIVAALLLSLPQLLYWKAVTGDLLVFTYGKKGEAFDWWHPHLWDLLTHPWNGWFVYAPIMIGVIAALLIMSARKVPGARTILLIWMITWYLIASWWSWWLGGAYGHRAFVEHMAFLAVPAAWLADRVLHAKHGIRIVAGLLTVLAIYFSIGLSWNYASPWDGPEWTWASVGNEYRRLLP